MSMIRSIHRRSAGLCAAVGLALLCLAAPPALADDALAAAKAAGQVGERPDGLVAARPGAPAAVDSLVSSINTARLSRYRAIAAQNGTSLPSVQALAGKELIARTPAGQYVMDSAGQWMRK